MWKQFVFKFHFQYVFCFGNGPIIYIPLIGKHVTVYILALFLGGVCVCVGGGGGSFLCVWGGGGGCRCVWAG